MKSIYFCIYLMMLLLTLPIICILFIPDSAILNWHFKSEREVLSPHNLIKIKGLITKNIINTGILHDFVLNKINTHNIVNIVILSNDIPFITNRTPWNAFYRRSLDTIFIDKLFIEFIDSTDYDNVYQDLFLFVLLHELAHRQLGHRDSNFKTNKNEEYAADSLALNWIIKLTGNDIVHTKERVQNLVMKVFLGELLTQSPLSLSEISMTHPALIQRCAALIQALSSQASLIKTDAKIMNMYAKWLQNAADDCSKRILLEIIPPNNHLFVSGCKGNNNIFLLLDNGQVSKINSSDIKNLISSGIKGSRPPKDCDIFLDYELEISVPELQSSIMWKYGNYLYLLTGFSELWRISLSDEISWERLGQMDFLIGKTPLAVHNLNNGNIVVISADPEGIYLHSILLLDNKIKVNWVTTREHGLDILSREPNWYYQYSGISDNFAYIMKKTGDPFLTEIGLMRISLSNGSVESTYRKIQPRMASNPSNLLEMIIPISEDTLLGVGRKNLFDISIWRITPNSEVFNIGDIKTLLTFNPLYRYYGDNLGSGPPDRFFHPFERVFAMIDCKQLAIQLRGLGFFVYDVPKSRIVLIEGISTLNPIGMQIGNKPFLLTAMSGGERAFIWYTGNLEGE